MQKYRLIQKEKQIKVKSAKSILIIWFKLDQRMIKGD